jgi:hypothetical protein
MLYLFSLTQQLAPGHRSSRISNLSNHVIYANPFCWDEKFLYKYVLPSVAHVGPSTCKRLHEYPFSYKQNLARNDTHELIDKKGSECIKMKKWQVDPHFLTATAYHDGYGEVALGISSGAKTLLSKHWDFQLVDPKDRYRVIDDTGDWSFKVETLIHSLEREGRLSDLFLFLLCGTVDVKPLMTEGSDNQAWFVVHAFSFTSSMADKITHAMVDYAYNILWK